MDDEFDWAHRRDEPFLFPEAGEGARKQERAAAEGKSGLRRFAERVLGVHSDERAWRRGAEGEEEVARRLGRLPAGWAVVHDLTIGSRGANLDHLVIGPPGVFTLNTKHLSGRVTVYERAFLHNGYKTNYLPRAVEEGRKVSRALTAVLGEPVVAQPVIVLMGAEVNVKAQPAAVAIVGRRHIRRWLEARSAQDLSAGDVLALERAARTPSTWPTPSGRAAPAASAAPRRQELAVRAWQRYGKHRLYVNDADGTTLGWMDVQTGRVTVDREDRRADVMAALQQHARREWR